MWLEKGVLDKVMSTARSGLIFVTTCNRVGMPHLAVAGKLKLSEKDQVELTDWFCPGTALNVKPGCLISVVIWDPITDVGHQLLGRVEYAEKMAQLNGYKSMMAEEDSLEERKLAVNVERVLEFRRGPHSDREE